MATRKASPVILSMIIFSLLTAPLAHAKKMGKKVVRFEPPAAADYQPDPERYEGISFGDLESRDSRTGWFGADPQDTTLIKIGVGVLVGVLGLKYMVDGFSAVLPGSPGVDGPPFGLEKGDEFVVNPNGNTAKVYKKNGTTIELVKSRKDGLWKVIAAAEPPARNPAVDDALVLKLVPPQPGAARDLREKLPNVGIRRAS